MPKEPQSKPKPQPAASPSVSVADFAPGALVHQLAAGVVYFVPGKVLAVNDTLCTLTGRSRDELMAMRSLEHIIYPADRQLLEERFIKRMRGETVPDTYVCRLLHADGSFIVVQHTAKVMQDAQTGFTVLSTLVEISPSVGVVERLKSLEEGLMGTVNNFNGFLFNAIITPEGKPLLRYISQGIERMTGVKVSELVGSDKFLKYIHRKDQGALVNNIMRVNLLGNRFPTISFRVVCPDGREVWIENNSSFRPQPDGSVLVDGVGVDITSLMNARRELKRRETYYRALVQAQPDTLITLSPDGRVLDFKLGTDSPNRHFDGLAVGTSVTRLFAPAFASRLLVALKRPFEDHKPVMLDYEITQGGHRHFFEGRLVRVDDSQLLLTLRNATERAERLRSLTETSHQLDLAMTSSRISVWEFDAELENWLFDWRTFEALGYAEQEVNVTDLSFWSRVLHPDDVAEFYNAFNLVSKQAGKRFEVEHRMLHRKTGKALWYITRGESMLMRNGKIKILGTTIDITQTREAERLIARQRELLQKLFDRMPILLVLLDPAGYVTLYNQEVQRVMELDANERIHIDTLALIFRADVGFEQLIQNADDSPQWQQIKMRASSGRLMQTRWLASRLMDGTMLLLGQDITEEQAYEDYLRISLQEKEMLVQEVYHRVKNNLQIIISLIDLQASGMSDPSLRDLIHDFKHRIQAIALVHQQLYQSRERRHLQLDEYVNSLLGSVLQSFQSDLHRVSFELEVDACLLDIDTTMRIGLVLNELITNSLKYAFHNTEGIIYVKASVLEPGLLKIQVGDNGVGFEYKRPTGNDTSAHGLQIVELLIRQLGGRLAFEQNNGSHFSFNVSYQPSELELAAEEA